MSPQEPAHILIVDDDADILTAGRMLLKRAFAHVSTLCDPQELPETLARDRPDVILLDMNFAPGASDGTEGLRWLERIRAQDPQAVVVMITAHGGITPAVEAMKRGASDFVAKPWQNEKFLATVSAGVALAKSRREAAELRSRAATLAADSARAEQPLIGNSPAMREVHRLIARAAPTQANVLILGENGTGKELVARAIHRASGRAEAVFLSVDLGAIPETLFESELFGHRRGAFTDARADRTGRLEAASGGTLFLDEIGNLPLHLQAKLLTVLERREVVPIGATAPVPIDVRIVSATNLSPEKLADPAVFRSDLLYRLNTVEIHLPPLAARREDIPALVAHYVAYYERKYGKATKPVSAEAMAALVDYPWPGNVRALRHAVERAVILAAGDSYEVADFSLATPGAPAAAVRPGERDFNLERIERTTIAAALKAHGYNISHTAEALGLTRAALYRRMEKYGL